MIKSTVNDKQVYESTEYPKIMHAKHSDVVILFHDHGAGVVVGGSALEIGRYRDDWLESDYFVLFHGSITIEQE
jgi:hypothetical protein